MTWYYVKDGEAAGPISDEALLSKLRLGSILPTTLVWRSGMAEWQSASKVAPEIVLPPALEAPASDSFGAVIDAPPELTSGTPPVLPNFFCTYCGVIIPADQLVRIGGRAVCAACKPVYVQQVREGMDAPVKAPVIGGLINALPAGPDSDLADPAIRLVAYILDLVFLTLPSMIGFFVFLMILGVLAAQKRTSGPDDLTVGFAAFALVGLMVIGVLLYWSLFIGRRGATPGMKIMKVKMVRSDRGRVGYARAFGRTVLLYIINLFTMSLTNITAFFDREKRTVVDMLCDTRVVRE